MNHHNFEVLHHGAINGVTGSCHELLIDNGAAVLVDCGLFQGNEEASDGAEENRLEIEFPINHIQALIVTHVHIDHVGRIPYLLAADFKGPIICSEPSAHLLPLMLEDAIRIGFTRNKQMVKKFLSILKERIVAVPYHHWHEIDMGPKKTPLSVRLKPAGHIMGSAYVECQIGQGKNAARIIFSGDLGAPWSPLLPAPKSPWRADMVVLESTYGDRNHEHRRDRSRRFQHLIERALKNRGTLLIPAFSIGRTQELLYELEGIIYKNRHRSASADLAWDDLEIIVDSPLASRFTDAYRTLRPYWDAEARKRLKQGRHPLSFEQLITIDSHEEHIRTVEYLAKTEHPAIVIAASGMCAGGRVMNYLKAMLEHESHDVLFVGYQAEGTPGRTIQKYGPNQGYVELEGRRYSIRAGIHTLGGYSAHAGQRDLVNFIRRMRHKPS
ncbi:MAG TPA: MBL fold metallo-hydrolase, partial [Gammaproteobacteria bacterium]|nr:MBL fold metallo-hydrolase [Gammaproteobacteria bacterium]